MHTPLGQASAQKLPLSQQYQLHLNAHSFQQHSHSQQRQSQHQQLQEGGSGPAAPPVAYPCPTAMQLPAFGSIVSEGTGADSTRAAAPAAAPAPALPQPHPLASVGSVDSVGSAGAGATSQAAVPVPATAGEYVLPRQLPEAACHSPSPAAMNLATLRASAAAAAVTGLRYGGEGQTQTAGSGQGGVVGGVLPLQVKNDSMGSVEGPSMQAQEASQATAAAAAVATETAAGKPAVAAAGGSVPHGRLEALLTKGAERSSSMVSASGAAAACNGGTAAVAASAPGFGAEGAGAGVGSCGAVAPGEGDGGAGVTDNADVTDATDALADDGSSRSPSPSKRTAANRCGFAVGCLRWGVGVGRLRPGTECAQPSILARRACYES